MKNVFLFLGPEELDAQEMVDSLFDKSNADEQTRLFAFNAVDVETLISDIMTPSLFGNVFFYILENCEVLKAKEIKKLKDAIENSITEGYLILRSNETKITSAVENLVKKENKKIFYLMFESKLPSFVSSLVKEKNYTISQEAISAFLSLVEHDKKSLKLAVSELVMNFSFKNKENSNITEDDVYNILCYDRDDDSLDLFSYIALKNLQGAVMCADAVFADTRNFTIGFQSLLTYIRKAVQYKENVKLEESNPFFINTFGVSAREIKFPKEKESMKSFDNNYTLLQSYKALKIILNLQDEIRLQSQPSQQRALLAQALCDIIE